MNSLWKNFKAPFCFRFKGNLIGELNLLTAVYILSMRERRQKFRRSSLGRMKLGFPLARAKLGSVSVLSHTGLIGLFWQAGVCIGKKSALSGAPKICIQKVENYYHTKYSAPKN